MSSTVEVNGCFHCVLFWNYVGNFVVVTVFAALVSKLLLCYSVIRGVGAGCAFIGYLGIGHGLLSLKGLIECLLRVLSN